jgi:hypothetical protein
MDANKLKKLKEIKYQIRKCCGTCKHANFPANDWSTCQFHTYQHQKHTVEMRNLSVNSYGYCPSFEWSEFYLKAELGLWLSFTEGSET